MPKKSELEEFVFQELPKRSGPFHEIFQSPQDHPLSASDPSNPHLQTFDTNHLSDLLILDDPIDPSTPETLEQRCQRKAQEIWGSVKDEL
jgi:hypothetical protein